MNRFNLPRMITSLCRDWKREESDVDAEVSKHPVPALSVAASPKQIMW
jgi:hypothetical protein